MVPGRSPGTIELVEAGGQYIRGFRCGLDYAFIRAASQRGCGACYAASVRGILVFTQSMTLAANL